MSLVSSFFRTQCTFDVYQLTTTDSMMICWIPAVGVL